MSRSAHVRKVKPTDIGNHSHGKETPKISWEETYRAMSAEAEDWSDLDITVSDGLD